MRALVPCINTISSMCAPIPSNLKRFMAGDVGRSKARRACRTGLEGSARVSSRRTAMGATGKRAQQCDDVSGRRRARIARTSCRASNLKSKLSAPACCKYGAQYQKPACPTTFLENRRASSQSVQRQMTARRDWAGEPPSISGSLLFLTPSRVNEY
jgi:hypothetical protein